MKKTAAEIARFVNGDVIGDGSVVITGLSGIKEAKEGDLTFLANPKYAPLLQVTKASAVIAPKDTKTSGRTLILTDNPSLSFSKIANEFIGDHIWKVKGIHPTALIAEDVRLGKNVAIGPYVVISQGSAVGDNTVIHAGCVIGQESQIGRDCLIYPQVAIRERITIGNRVIIHSGTVVGSDGFGYVTVDGMNTKIPQLGTVVVEDDVEIGANVTIDRARFDKTLIGRGAKIDNLVQIAHNVIIGENCIIVAQVGISGSTVLEKGVVVAGQAGIAGHLVIGEGSVIMAQTGISKSVPKGSVLFGYPGKPYKEAVKTNAHIQRLSKYVEKIQELEKRIQELEEKLRN